MSGLLPAPDSSCFADNPAAQDGDHQPDPPMAFDALVRRRMIWNSRADFGADVISSSGSGYAALR